MENKTLILIKGNVSWHHDYYLHHRLQLGLNCWKPTPAVFSGSSTSIVCPHLSVLPMTFWNVFSCFACEDSASRAKGTGVGKRVPVANKPTVSPARVWCGSHQRWQDNSSLLQASSPGSCQRPAICLWKTEQGWHLLCLPLNCYFHN